MDPAPISIKLSAPGGIAVVWNDGHLTTYPHDYLRQHCPCALCQETHLQIVKSTDPFPIAGRAPIKAISAAQVGHYAVQFFWYDNHSNGIYTYLYLRELCPCQHCEKR
jgi:DUF971 family protein